MITNPKNLFEGFNMKVFLLLIAAGVVGTICFEAFALYSKIALGKNMQPVVLVAGLTEVMFGMKISLYPAALILHLVTGAVFYPLLYLFILKTFPNGSVFFTGIVLGITTWILAQGVFSPMIGRDFMMGWSAFTLKSVIVHTVYALIIAFSFAFFYRRFVMGNKDS